MLDHPVDSSRTERDILGYLPDEKPRGLAWPAAAAVIFAASLLLWGLVAAAVSALGFI